MRLRVRWTRRSIRALDGIADFIAEDRPMAARTVVQRVIAAVDQLSEQPAMGRPGRVPGTRELVVPRTPFIVPYRVRKEHLEVLAVLHSSRRWPEDFP